MEGSSTLGCKQLSIIDVSGMTNEDQPEWIVFNGELYNFAELRKRLIDHHIFHTAREIRRRFCTLKKNGWVSCHKQRDKAAPVIPSAITIPIVTLTP
jgi:asparagine synthetase B (glutamine-hydrolysing)